jgi:hypothetical protein
MAIAPPRHVDSVASSSSRPDRLVGDPVLRVVEVDAGRLGAEALSSSGILGEEVTKVPLGHIGVVELQGLPGRARGQHRRCHSDLGSSLLEILNICLLSAGIGGDLHEPLYVG